MAAATKVAVAAEVDTTAAVVATTDMTDLLLSATAGATTAAGAEATTLLRQAGSRLPPARPGSELVHRLRHLLETSGMVVVDGDTNSSNSSHTAVTTQRLLRASTMVMVVGATRSSLLLGAMITGMEVDEEDMEEEEMVETAAIMAVAAVDTAAKVADVGAVFERHCSPYRER